MISIEKILEQRTGLSASIIGERNFDSAISRILKKYSLSGIEELADKLRYREEIFDSFIEEITIPETWLFRDKNVYEYLPGLVWKILNKNNPDYKINILSAPCSTGEEAYSIAISLLNSGFKGLFKIKALDINKKSIDFAGKGIYTKNSLRDTNLNVNYLNYLAIDDKHVRVKPELKEHIEFSFGNLIDENCIEEKEKFDIIFSRNLLIYFDKESRERYLKVLRRHFNDNGVLFCGHSEKSWFISKGFDNIDEDGVFACKYLREKHDIRQQMKAARKIKSNHTPQKKLTGSEKRTRQKYIEKSRHIINKPKPVKAEKSAEDEPLNKAMYLANQGETLKAEKICLDIISENKVEYQAYYILGLIKESINDIIEAEVFFNKVLYLNPSHHESLVHLSLIHNKLGNNDLSDRYKLRAEKVFFKREDLK